ncbi:hypothetical protein ACN27F_19995 [Solwaraspora sp. WMMB335]
MVDRCGYGQAEAGQGNGGVALPAGGGGVEIEDLLVAYSPVFW